MVQSILSVVVLLSMTRDSVVIPVIIFNLNNVPTTVFIIDKFLEDPLGSRAWRSSKSFWRSASSLPGSRYYGSRCGLRRHVSSTASQARHVGHVPKLSRIGHTVNSVIVHVPLKFRNTRN